MRRREIPGQVRFVTFSCQRRLPLFSNAKIANVFAQSLTRARATMRFDLYAWVVMPEHVHLLLRPNDDDTLARALWFLKKSVAHRVLARWRRLRAPVLARLATPEGSARFWQKGGGFDRNVRDEAEFCKTVHYIHQNPVGRGLVERAEQWTWSSVRWWMGERAGELECDPPPVRAWEHWKGFRDW
ncbi:MAG: transposase [Phycisphaerales bacterium]